MRMSTRGTTCKGKTWVGVFSFAGQEWAITSAQAILHKVTPRSLLISLCLREDTNIPPSASVFSFPVVYSIVFIFIHSSGQSSKVQRSCNQSANNRQVIIRSGTNSTGRAWAKHFASMGQRNPAFCKLSEQTSLKPAVFQGLPPFNTTGLLNLKATNTIVIGIKCSLKEKNSVFPYFTFLNPIWGASLLSIAKKTQLQHQSDHKVSRTLLNCIPGICSI